jgi:hypothetical protein
LLNILVFGLNRFPQSSLPAFQNFIDSIETCQLNILAGFIVPPAKRVHNMSSGETNVLLEDPLGTSWNAYVHKYIGAYYQDDFTTYSSYHVYDAAWKSSRGRIDIFNDEYQSVSNYLSYLYASYLFSTEVSKYLADGPAMLIRPDVLYSSSRPLLISPIETTDILTLGYDKYGEINDRFFVSSSHNIISILRRICFIPRYIHPPWRYFHSECFTRWFIQRHLPGRIHYAPPSLTAKRIRSNGNVEISDSVHYEGLTRRSLIAKNFFRESAISQFLLSVGLKR